MKILKKIEDFNEMDLFDLGQQFPNSKLLRVELSTWDHIYVCYEGNVSIKTLSSELQIDNLNKDNVIKNI